MPGDVPGLHPVLHPGTDQPPTLEVGGWSAGGVALNPTTPRSWSGAGSGVGQTHASLGWETSPNRIAAMTTEARLCAPSLS